MQQWCGHHQPQHRQAGKTSTAFPLRPLHLGCQKMLFILGRVFISVSPPGSTLTDPPRACLLVGSSTSPVITEIKQYTRVSMFFTGVAGGFRTSCSVLESLSLWISLFSISGQSTSGCQLHENKTLPPFLCLSPSLLSLLFCV